MATARSMDDALAPDHDAVPAKERTGALRRLLHFLAEVLSSPQGDLGGWEGGARGL